MNTPALVAARELSPLIVRLRDDTEANRNIAAPIVDRLRDGRLCRLAVAEALAGLAVPLDAALDVYETLAYADASVAWIAWNNSLPCFLSRFLAPGMRAEVFSDPRWLYACSTRPTGRATVTPDGYRVTGRWGIVSGCELAEWILLLCVVEENGKPRMRAPDVPELRFVFLRRGSYEILDTWHVGGLRGTGSHDVVVKDVPVPRALTLFVSEPSTLDAPLGRLPIICSMAAVYGAQVLGVAQSAVDTLVELTTTKVPPEGPALRERPAVLGEIGRHSAALDAARSYLRACAAQLWRTAVDGGPPALDEITAMWGAGLHAASVAEAAVDAMYAAGGINSLYTACPLERAHRDMHAMRRHIVGQPMWLEDAGRVRLGAKPTHPLYAV
ncbi:MAG TPA: acyl-CoA dehydrogenase family protein [Gammaproteobacteria bacterium]|nr:acyl-CoA dehydrogenase family protein [Gammaproteobacteria bacterium]